MVVQSQQEALEKRCEICSMSAIKIPKRSHWHRSGVFIVNFEYIFSTASIVEFE